MERRILESDIWKVIQTPQQTVKSGTDKIIFQSILTDEHGKEYLIRVFINVVKNPKLVITVYKTSKILSSNQPTYLTLLPDESRMIRSVSNTCFSGVNVRDLICFSINLPASAPIFSAG